MEYLLILIFFLFFIDATIMDLDKMQIENYLIVFMMIVVICCSIANNTLLWTGVSMIITIPAGLIALKKKWIGAGDIKFLIVFFSGSHLVWEKTIAANLFFMFVAFYVAHAYIFSKSIHNKVRRRIPFMPSMLISFSITSFVLML